MSGRFFSIVTGASKVHFVFFVDYATPLHKGALSLEGQLATKERVNIVNRSLCKL